MPSKKFDLLRAIVPDVSRETFDRLLIYEALVQEWGRKLNLVAPSTWNEMWERHILDSAQLFTWLQSVGAPTLDLGSGAGFPGMVLAILGCSSMTLLDATRKKCSFLEIVSRETMVPVSVVWGRAEELEKSFDQVTARAVANLTRLMDWVEPLLNKGGVAYFLKGEKWAQEIREAQQKWGFTYEMKESTTHSKGALLKVMQLRCLS